VPIFISMTEHISFLDRATSIVYLQILGTETVSALVNGMCLRPEILVVNIEQDSIILLQPNFVTRV